MSKSLIYLANEGTTQNTTAEGTAVNFGNIVRKYGCDINASGGSPVVKTAGYYTAIPNISLTASDAGTVTVTAYHAGNEIPGAKAVMGVAKGFSYTFSFPAPLRVMCGCQCQSGITVKVSGVAATITNAAIEVIKS